MKQRLLMVHGIHFATFENRLKALDEWVDKTGQSQSNWIDIQDWSVKDLMAWLGY